MSFKLKTTWRLGYTSEEVLNEVFVDPDSDFDSDSGESEDESYVGESGNEESSEESETDEEMIENDDENREPRGGGTNRGRGTLNSDFKPQTMNRYVLNALFSTTINFP